MVLNLKLLWALVSLAAIPLGTFLSQPCAEDTEAAQWVHRREHTLAMLST
jgi:hypothetical protein